MTRDLLLAIGILLTTASQFRSDSAPIGPGELCLAIWIALTLGREALRLEPRFTPAFSRLVIFLAVFRAGAVHRHVDGLCDCGCP
jgi:hypothetical protein